MIASYYMLSRWYGLASQVSWNEEMLFCVDYPYVSFGTSEKGPKMAHNLK